MAELEVYSVLHLGFCWYTVPHVWCCIAYRGAILRYTSISGVLGIVKTRGNKGVRGSRIAENLNLGCFLR